MTGVGGAGGQIRVRPVEVFDDDGGPSGRSVDAEQAGGRGSGRKRGEDVGFVKVGGRERVTVGGGLDEGAAAVVRGEGGGELVAEPALRRDDIGDRGAEGTGEVVAEQAGKIGPAEAAGGGWGQRELTRG